MNYHNFLRKGCSAYGRFGRCIDLMNDFFFIQPNRLHICSLNKDGKANYNPFLRQRTCIMRTQRGWQAYRFRSPCKTKVGPQHSQQRIQAYGKCHKITNVGTAMTFIWLNDENVPIRITCVTTSFGEERAPIFFQQHIFLNNLKHSRIPPSCKILRPNQFPLPVHAPLLTCNVLYIDHQASSPGVHHCQKR